MPHVAPKKCWGSSLASPEPAAALSPPGAPRAGLCVVWGELSPVHGRLQAAARIWEPRGAEVSGAASCVALPKALSCCAGSQLGSPQAQKHPKEGVCSFQAA